MFRSPQSILRRPPLKEGDGDNERQYQRESKKQHGTDIHVTTGVDQEILRNLSSETYSTANSSGIYSLELLMDIYPSISDSESDFKESQDDDFDRETVIHMNHSEENITTDNQKEEVVNKDVSLFRRSNRDIASCWVEDKPFDEESLRAMSEIMSERGDCIENVYSKGFDRVEEYILPPVDFSETIIGISADEKRYDVVKKSSMNSTSRAPIVHSLSSDYEHKENSGNTSFEPSKKASNDKKRIKRHGVSTKFLCIAFILAVLLLAGGIAFCIVASLKSNEKNASSNQATAASSDLTESEVGKNEDSASDSSIFPAESDTQSNKPTSADAISIDDEVPPNSSVDSSPNLPTIDIIDEKLSSDVPTNSPSKDLTTNEPDQSPTATDELSWGTLVTYLDPIPEDFFPLGLCAGDCDRDADCDEGLVCFQRGPNDLVPFCYGGENDNSRTDYCTYPSYDGEECSTNISVVQDCFFGTENVIVVTFENCNPKDEDWIGLYPNGISFDDGSPATEWTSYNYIDWAYTCGDTICEDSPLTHSFAFPKNDISAYGFLSLRVYLLRNSIDGPPYEVIAKSESFAPSRRCQ